LLTEQLSPFHLSVVTTLLAASMVVSRRVRGALQP